MSVQTHFRLFDLPYELVEYVCFSFFNIHEAHKLLTVSRAFHSLLSRILWKELVWRIFALPQPTRSMAFAHYGKLVHEISFNHGTCSAIARDISRGASIYDILSVFPRVTTLRICHNRNLLISNGIQFIEIIMYFPNLCRLYCEIKNDKEPYDLVTLALAINHRQNNCDVRPIEYLGLGYSVGHTDTSWTRLTNFIHIISYTGIAKIEITSWSTSVLPSQSEIQTLSKYLTCIPEMDAREDTQFCYATLNRSYFWKPIDMCNTCAYPKLLHLSIRTCCVNSLSYDYCEITPANIPLNKSMDIYGHECNDMISYSHSPAWKKVLLQSWPHLNELTLSVNMSCEQFVAVLEYNVRLTALSIELKRSMLDKNEAFNLATVLRLLPKLQRLEITGENAMKLDYNPDYDDSDILTRSKLSSASFSSLDLSSRIYKLLYSLPKLVTIYIQCCRFSSAGVNEVASMNELINDINEISMADNDDDDSYMEMIVTLNILSAKYLFNCSCAIKQFSLDISEDDYDWSLDFTLEMIALMPKLRVFNFTGETCEIPMAVNERFPYVKVSS